MLEKFLTGSTQETQTKARVLAEGLKGGEVVCLYGELGSGKTTFVQGLASELGAQGPITSPTFNILKQYCLENNPRLRRFYHIDCYRISDSKELLDLGFKEWISDKEGVVAIEWAEKAEAILPVKRIEVSLRATGIEDGGKEAREIEINRT